MGRRMWRWVSRDVDCDYLDVWAGEEKPKDCGGFFRHAGGSAIICAKEFKSLFGVCPNPGECLKVLFKPASVYREKVKTKKRSGVKVP